MRTLIFTLFISLGATVYSQIPSTPQVVIDPTSIEKITKTIEIGLETNKTLKESQQILSQINAAVTTSRQIAETIRLQKESLEFARLLSTSDFSRIKPTDARDILQRASLNIENINNLVSDLNKILTTDFFKMSDKERIDLLQLNRDKAFIQWAKLKGMVANYYIK
ncbi:MAG: hypothetical protein RL662_2187 [Bacteroidota bacterium]|jgi:hypothetical protein